MEEPVGLPPASNMDEFREPMPSRAPAADGPTIADLTYDDTLDDIGRIARYGSSSVALQRLVHVKLMSDTARSVGCVHRKGSQPRARRPAADPVYADAWRV